jgi:hypothetical protein
VFNRITENRRWSHYWFGKTGIDDVYAGGKAITALIFWNKSESQPIRGLCSPELALCVAYSGIYLDPAERRMSKGSAGSLRSKRSRRSSPAVFAIRHTLRLLIV